MNVIFPILSKANNCCKSLHTNSGYFVRQSFLCNPFIITERGERHDEKTKQFKFI